MQLRVGERLLADSLARYWQPAGVARARYPRAACAADLLAFGQKPVHGCMEVRLFDALTEGQFLGIQLTAQILL